MERGGESNDRTMERLAPLVVALLLVSFGVVGVLRLNPFCLLEPDSADYLFTSRALVTLQGYTEIDHPARPAHTFRPPGLPLLLAPVSAVLPYDVVAAKVFLLLVSLLALYLVWTLARRYGSAVAALAALLLVVTGPYTLLHATEVVSEMPYVAALLASLLLATRERGPGWRGGAAMTVLLAALPLVRSVGLVWLLAMLAWSLLTRSRRWLIPIGVAALVNALWMLRNQRTGAVTYFSGMLHEYRQSGVGGYLVKVVDAAGFYLGKWFAVLLPGLFAETPLYDRFLLVPAPNLAGLAGMAYVLGAVVTGLAIIGCAARWRAGGGLVLVYAAGFVGLLLVYPPRHERLIWPLVPLVWIFAPAGLAAVRSRLAARRWSPGRATAWLAAACVLSIAAWQTVASVAIAGVNVEWRRDRDGFQARTVPPVYYADWAAAGRWLAANAPRDARVLTRHSDLGLTSGLAQDSVRFEEISPLDLHARIATLKPSYLALPATRFRWLAPPHLLQGSPVYRFEPVYERGDVLIVEVRPNREGTVGLDASGLDARIAECTDASRRLPRRADVRRRLAELLHEAGRSDEALETLAPLDDAGALVTTARIQIDRDDPAAALDAYRRAQEAPGAADLAGTIERGIANALERQRLAELPVELRLRDELDRARTFLQSLLFANAATSVERAERLAPGRPEVAFARAVLLDRTGDLPRAEAQYRMLARLGLPAAAVAEAGLRRERALRDGTASAGPEIWLELAASRAGEGLTGRALDLLERAAVRHPGSPEIRRRLDELYGFYGRSAPR